MDSARANLASTYVNAFVNAGFGQDKLVLSTPAAAAGSASGADQPKWIHRNKGHGQFGAAASLGMLLMWDIDDGLQKIDKYSYSAVHDIKGGALLVRHNAHAVLLRVIGRVCIVEESQIGAL